MYFMVVLFNEMYRNADLMRIYMENEIEIFQIKKGAAKEYHKII